MAGAQGVRLNTRNLISRHFGEVLRKYRLALGWSQSTLSSRSRVDRTYISQIECGVHSPTITVLCRLSRALQVSPSALVMQLERRLGSNGMRRAVVRTAGPARAVARPLRARQAAARRAGSR